MTNQFKNDSMTKNAGRMPFGFGSLIGHSDLIIRHFQSHVVNNISIFSL